MKHYPMQDESKDRILQNWQERLLTLNPGNKNNHKNHAEIIALFQLRDKMFYQLQLQLT